MPLLSLEIEQWTHWLRHTTAHCVFRKGSGRETLTRKENKYVGVKSEVEKLNEIELRLILLLFIVGFHLWCVK